MRRLMMVLLVLLCAARAFPQDTKYVSTKYGFSIQLPKGWTISKPGIETNGGYTNYAVRATHSGVVINVQVEDWYANKLTADQRKSI